MCVCVCVCVCVCARACVFVCEIIFGSHARFGAAAHRQMSHPLASFSNPFGHRIKHTTGEHVAGTRRSN